MASGYYPPGAEYDPNAPYNQYEPEPKTFVREYAITLYQSFSVEDDRYHSDGMGGIDDSDCDFVEDFEMQKLSPKQLLQEYADILTGRMENVKAKKPNGWREKVKELQLKIECCNYEEEIIELA